MRRKLILPLLSICLLIGLTGCGSNSSQSVAQIDSVNTGIGSHGIVEYSKASKVSASDSVLTNSNVVADASSSNYSESNVKNDTSSESVSEGNKNEVNTNAKIIYTGNVSINTLHIDEVGNLVKYKVESLGGYISQINQNDVTINITAKVPAENFQSLLYDEEISKGNKVSRSMNSKDVTLEYSDTAAELSSLKVQEERILGYMEKADNLDNLLRLESQLQQVRNNIESTTRRLNLLDNQVTYSTIDFHISSTYNDFPEQSTTFWQRLCRTFEEMGYDFLSTSEGILFGIISFIPSLFYLGVFGFIVFIIVKKIRKHRKERKSKKNINTEDSGIGINKVITEEDKENVSSYSVLGGHDEKEE